MKSQLYNLKSEKIGEIALPKNIFEVKAPDSLIAQAIRVTLTNRRSSFAKTKTRSEVAGTRKKVWSQKGTGNARHGNRTAPIFIGGGIAMGPDGQQNYSLKISKNMKKKALYTLLSKFAASKKILVIDNFSKLDPKTKSGVKLITGLKSKDKVLSKSRKIGIITTNTLTPVKRAFGNIKDISLISLKSLNVYDLSKQNYLIFSQKAIKQFK
ncbi:MAG TPA: 50S ribosomal protein L4 [Candidatus Woesebacteria bacterium]|jgi:large subunit ribosomal protein L4|nr:50S ribosomal protein L4 [Candidatus Shapirobacteria bacterium]HOR01859.1 50S ribosomal protein L4 [Candidatus Woesebacteria bacterium]